MLQELNTTRREIERPISFVRSAVRAVVGSGDIVVDATVGNGHDTLLLAELVGPSGRVFGFDVQSAALDATTRRLDEVGIADRVTLTLGGHERMLESLPDNVVGAVACVMFNLGYLPGSDKSVVTQPETTLRALDGAIRLIGSTGVVSVMVYPRHPGGDAESTEVLKWARALDPFRYDVMRYEALNQANSAFAILVTAKDS